MLQNFLIAGVLGFMSGIVCRSFFVVPTPLLLFVGVVTVLFFLCALHYRAQALFLAAVFLCCVLLGVVRMNLVPQSLPDTFTALLEKKVTLVGVVDADADLRETTQRVVIRVSQDSSETRMLAVLPLYPRLEYGDSVRVAGTFVRPEAFDTAGGRTFAYPEFLAKDQIFSMLTSAKVIARDTILPLQGQPLRSLYKVRHWFEAGVSQALPEPMSALAIGLLTGGKQGLGEALLLAFTVSGLLPIVVLSGYNVMIVAESVQRFFRFLPRRFSILVAAITVLLFVLASGAGASAVRAGMMAGVALFARATGRTYDALRALVFVLVFMVILQPHILVYDPGFQFSFMATLGLILLSPRILPFLMWIKSPLVRDTLSTTIAAQLCVLPLLLYATGNLSFVAVPANLLVLPVIPLTMLFSFVAGVMGMVAPLAAPVVGLPAYALLSYMIEVARRAGEFSLSATTLDAFPFWIVLVLYAMLFLVARRLPKTTSATQGSPT